ncbi:MAG: DUF4340 domain-containing protein [Gammaproteobacteria bacterium]
MKPLHVVILALLAVGAGAAVWFSGLSNEPVEEAVQKLFPNLADNLDAVTQVVVSDAAGAKVTLDKKNSDWTVKEKKRYFAKRNQVAELVLAVSEARIVEQKTANPEYYERLGVRDIKEPDSNAVLLTLSSATDTFSVLLGNASGRMGGSTFVRKPDEATSLLVAPALSAITDADAWLDKAIVDIAADDVQSVKITSGGKVTEVSKEAIVGSDFKLVGRNDDELDQSAVSGLGGGLAGLTFERALPGAAFAVNDYERKTVTYTLFSGVVIDVTLFSREPSEQTESSDKPPAPAQYWLNASARFDEDLAQSFVPQPSAVDGAEPKRFRLTAADMADRRAEVEQFNKTRRPWVYKMSAERYSSMNQTDLSLVATP